MSLFKDIWDLVRMAWDPELHPRDEQGRFTNTGEEKPTEAEEAALRHYTGGGYFELNQELRAGASISELPEGKLVLSGLSKLPKFEGKTLRSESFNSEDKFQQVWRQLEQGKVVCSREFLSSTKSSEVSGRFANTPLIIEYTIKGKSGGDLDVTRYNRSEEEVLFAPRTRFLVEGKSVSRQEGFLLGRVYLSEVQSDVRKMAWDPDLHPRDEQGRFTSTGGGKLEEAERYSLKNYGTVGYIRINDALRSGIPLSKVKDAPEVLSAMNKLPAVQGKFFRGEHFYNETDWRQSLNQLKPGKVVSAPEFMSTSTSPLVAASFTQPKGTNTKAGLFYHIEGRSGRDISKLTTLGHEKEVLFPPRTRFMVVSVKDYPGGRVPVKDVTLREVSADLRKADWDPEKHPRVGAGSPEGGEFAPEDASGWKQVGVQRGSNPGGLYQAPDGSKYYVKFYEEVNQTKSEIKAQQALREVGCWAPEGREVQMKGQVALANRWEENIQGFTGTSMRQAVLKDPEGAGRIFGASVVTQNWDVVGLAYDNLVKVGNKLGCVDTGGAFTFRAQGGPKPFTTDAKEIRGLTDPGINPQAAKIFSGLTDNEKFAQGAHEAVTKLQGWFKGAPGVTKGQFDQKCRATLSAIEKWRGFHKTVEDLLWDPEDLWKAEWQEELHPRDEHGRFISAALNRTPVFHGTAEAYLASIQQKGLEPRIGASSASRTEPGIYVSIDQESAKTYGKYAALQYWKSQGKPVPPDAKFAVLEIQKAGLAGFKPTEQDDWTWHNSQVVKPEFIKSVKLYSVRTGKEVKKQDSDSYWLVEVLDEGLGKGDWDPEKHPRDERGRFSEVDEETIRDLHPGAGALLQYMKTGYEEVNSELRAGATVSGTDHCKEMLQYLQTVPELRGTVYRGEFFTNDPKQHLGLEVGKEVTPQGFLSCSHDPVIAEEFAAMGLPPQESPSSSAYYDHSWSVFYQIESHTGKDLTRSEVGPIRSREQEVLFPPRTRFEIVGVQEHHPDSKTTVYHVDMVEKERGVQKWLTLKTSGEITMRRDLLPMVVSPQI